MKLVWHIFKKDLRRLWPHLLLCAVAGAVASTMSLHVRPRIDEGYHFSNWLIWFAPCGLLWFSLFPAIVQADSPNGTTEFWMTRPLGWGKLFGGKILLALIVGVGLTASAQGLFLLTQGFRLDQAAHGAMHLLAPLMVACVCSVFFATLTRTLWSFWFLLIAVWTGGHLFDPFLGFKGKEHVAYEIQLARHVLIPALMSIAAIVVAAFHYRHRRRANAVVTSALLFWLITAGVALWPWSLPWMHRETDSAELLTWKAALMPGEHHQWQGNKRVRALAVRVLPPSGEAVRFNAAEGKINWSDGSGTTGDNRLEASTYVGRVEAIQAALGPDYVVNRESPDEDAAVKIALESRGDVHLRPVSYAGEIQGARVNFVLLGMTPLVGDARFVREGCKLIVDEIPKQKNAWRLIVRYQSPQYKKEIFGPNSVPLLVLVNSVQKQAWVLTARGNGTVAESNLPGLTVYAAAWTFDGDQRHRGGQIAVDDVWLAGAQLWAFVQTQGAPVRLPVVLSWPSFGAPDSAPSAPTSAVPAAR